MPTSGAHRSRALFIDTNLMLVLLIGALDRDQVERFKRTRAYTRADYDLLIAFVTEFDRIVATPNVVTEVSNLLGQLTEPLRRKALASLGAFTGSLEERYLPSRELAADAVFAVLGVADVSILHSAQAGLTVLTDDLALYQRLASAGGEVVNFNHLRTGAWP
jgi:hypothetical protein